MLTESVSSAFSRRYTLCKQMSTRIPLQNRTCYSCLSSPVHRRPCSLELEGRLTVCSVTKGRSPRPKAVKGGVTEKVQTSEVSSFLPSHHWAYLLNPCFSAALTVKMDQDLLQMRPLPRMFCSSRSQALAGQINVHGEAMGFQSLFHIFFF